MRHARSLLGEVRDEVLAWMEEVRYTPLGWGRWPYHAKMRRPFALQSSAMAIGILNRLGTLDSITPIQRQQAIEWFRSTQDPVDGQFKDPLVSEQDHVGPHSWDQIYGQWSVAETALRLLGGSPPYPLPKSRFVDLSSVDGATYTRSFAWENPWADGESWSRGLQAYLRGIGWKQGDNIPSVVRQAIQTLETDVLDPDSGTPRRLMRREDSSVAMAGLFKVISGYLAAGLPFPYPQAGIDSTLALQHDDGDWGFRRNMCMVWDALWILRELDLQLRHEYRFSDIRSAGDRTAEMLLRDYRKPDGGFAFYATHCTSNHHSVQLSDHTHPISDMMGTEMSIESLSYIDQWRREH